VNEEGAVHFTSVAPGSTGMMAGLGPGGTDFPPYGRPVIHVLAREKNHAPLLVDVPILPHHKTLEERQFSFGTFDWRGLAWSRKGKKNDLPFKITSWKPNRDDDHIDIEINLYLELVAADDSKNDDSTPKRSKAVDFFCSSWYGFPSSFFLQPIAVCAKSLLDFFTL
jgi:hypothetical protein